MTEICLEGVGDRKREWHGRFPPSILTPTCSCTRGHHDWPVKPTTRQDIWIPFSFRRWRERRFPNVTSSSGQAYAPEKILKALI
jgi:hypothetical protein